MAAKKIHLSSQETSTAIRRPSGIKSSDAAQAAKPPPKQKETSHIMSTLVSGARTDT